MPLLGVLAGTLLGFLADAIKGLVGRILVSLGVGLVTATGINVLINQALSAASFSTSNPVFNAALEAVGVPWFISTLFSAITTRMVLNGLSSDGFSFWRMRRQIG